MNKKLFFGIIIPFLIIVIGILIWQFWPSSGWKHYESQKYNFSIEYPKGWKVLDYANGNVNFPDVTFTPFTNNELISKPYSLGRFTISELDLIDNKDNIEVSRQILKGIWARTLGDIPVRDIYVSGFPAITTDNLDWNDSTQAKITQTWVVTPEKRILIEYSYPKAEEEEYLPIFFYMIQAIKIGLP